MLMHSRKFNAYSMFLVSLAAVGALLFSGATGIAQTTSDTTTPVATDYNPTKQELEQQKIANQQKQHALNLQQQKQNKDAAAAINQTSGVHVTPQQLAIPEEDLIHGFHPVKKLMSPIVRLEKNTVQLQQQIMKLEGPIAGLQKPMLGLHKKMGSVERRMNGMSNQLNTMQTNVMDVNKSMAGIHEQLVKMDGRVAQIEEPIFEIQKPLTEVAGPLSEVKQELMKVEALIGVVLFAIIVAAAAVAIGTPIAAVLIYRNRHKLFPGTPEHEFPVAKAEGIPNTQGTHKLA
jgi:uncharacterized coiled-coil DUF342 family protein